MVVRLALHNACYSSVSSWFEFEIPSIGEHVQTVRVGAAVQKVWATPFVVYVPLKLCWAISILQRSCAVSLKCTVRVVFLDQAPLYNLDACLNQSIALWVIWAGSHVAKPPL